MFHRTSFLNFITIPRILNFQKLFKILPFLVEAEATGGKVGLGGMYFLSFSDTYDFEVKFIEQSPMISKAVLHAWNIDIFSSLIFTASGASSNRLHLNNKVIRSLNFK